MPRRRQPFPSGGTVHRILDLLLQRNEQTHCSECLEAGEPRRREISIWVKQYFEATAVKHSGRRAGEIKRSCRRFKRCALLSPNASGESPIPVTSSPHPV